MKPFLKWAGGKRWLATSEFEFPGFDSFERYIEPFLGSGAVFFHLKPPSGILNDANEDLINLYQVVRDYPEEFEKILKKHAAKHSQDYYYQIRGKIYRSPIQRAAAFLYLNRTCWNGLYRVNRRGQFNVPKGTKDKVLLDDDFKALSRILKNVQLMNVDFETVIDLGKEGDLVFADPPYTVKHNNNNFIKYNETLFSWDDQIRLRDALVRAHNRGANIILTNADHESVKDLYEGIGIQYSLPRHSKLSGKKEFRKAVTELLVTTISDA